MPALRTRISSHSEPSTFKKDQRPARLSIQSPSPQKASFTFPDRHNLGDSPTSSPSSSPSPRFTIPNQSSQPFFPPPPIPIPSAGPFALKALAGSASSTSPKARLRKDGQVKRPENAFILFRRHRCLQRQKEMNETLPPSTGKGRSKPRQADLSKLISAEWKALPMHERSHWEMLAKEKKEAHEKQYPDYVYRPRKPKSDTPLSVSWKEANMISTPSDLPIPPHFNDMPQLPTEPQTFSIVVPTVDPNAPFDPTMPLEISYASLVFPVVNFDHGGSSSARNAWEQYQAILNANRPLQTPCIEIPHPPATPVTPVTPALTPILETLDSAFSPQEPFSPVPSEAPLYPPLPANHLASPFQETEKMPTYQTPVHSNWMWAGPPDAQGTPLSDDLNTFAVSPKDLGLFDEIDLGFAGDYSLDGQTPEL